MGAACHQWRITMTTKTERIVEILLGALVVACTAIRWSMRMSAQTATQAMADIRLAMGEAAEPLLQVIRAEIAQAAEDRTALARIAATRLDGEADEHGNDAVYRVGVGGGRAFSKNKLPWR